MKTDNLQALLVDTALQAGAKAAQVISVGDIIFDVAFRDICAANSCGKYGKCHMCPPDVGEINELIARAKEYSSAIVFQQVYPLEDSFDIEGMAMAKDEFRRLCLTLKRALPENALLLGAGACGMCDECTKPQGLPCKAPDLAIASLESYGIHVSRLAATAGMKYVNGPDTVTYFGTILLK